MKSKKLKLYLCLLTLLTSCNNVNSNKDTYRSLTIWTYYNSETENAFQELLKNFNTTKGKELKIAVTSQSQGSSVNDLFTSLLESANDNIGSKSLPDLFLAYPDTAFELDKKGKIANINDYFTKDELSIFNSGFLNEGKIEFNNDNIKILPVSKSTEALYINKTDFDKFLEQNYDLNIKYSDLSTIEGLIEVSKKYYERTGKAFYGRDSLDNYFVIGCKQLGIDVLRYDENNNYGINYDHDVFKKLWDSYYVPYVKGYFSSVGKFRSNDIMTGEILAYVGSTSSGGYFPNNVYSEDESVGKYKIDCEVLTAPYFADGEKYAVSQGAGFCVTKSSKSQEDASIQFLKWLTDSENLQSFCGNTGYFPATSDGFSSSFISSQKNENFKKTFQVAKKTTKEFAMYTNIVGEGGTSFRNKLKNSFSNALNSARSAVESATDKEAIIAEYTSDDKFESWFEKLSK